MSDIATNFQPQLTLGQAFEQRCRGILGKEGYMSFDAPTLDWDFELEGPGARRWRVECKLDIMAERTNNLYFEIQFRGSRSGIAATQADYWMVSVGARGPVFMFRVKPLYTFLCDCLEAGTAVYSERGGDDQSSRGVLLPVKMASRCPHFREF